MKQFSRIFSLAGIAILLLTGLNSCHEAPSSASNESQKLNAFLDRAFDRMLDRKPLTAAYLGIKRHYGDWNNVSDSFAAADLKAEESELDSMKNNFDLNKLDDNAKLSWKLFEKNVNDHKESYEYRFLSFPVNQEEGLHTEVPTFLVNVHLISSLQDAKDYISRLQKVKPLFDQLIVQLKEREKKKIIPPKFVYPKVITACENVIKGAPFDTRSPDLSPLKSDFDRKVDDLKSIATGTRDSLKKEADHSMLVSVKPAYESLVNYLTTLETKADTVVGAWSWPDGDKFYRMALRHQTTTNMTPEEIYNFGLKEVDRIHGEIRKIMKELNFKNDNIHDFFAFVKDPNNRKSFLPNTETGKQQYLDIATKYINTMKGRLDEIFITKPKADIVVKAVEKFRESSAGSAFYEQPAIDGSRPGRFYVNLVDMTQSPLYQLEALAYHEGIPGHHMQISIAQELTGVPKFRKYGEYTAYVEGWGLYSEFIPKEMGGFYTDPYSDFGRLTMELLRAARCVVDPGIHYKHWSRTQAINYFKQNTAEPPIECEHAIERYIVWPGQATAYKIGMNKILELREMAKKELGSKFNIREFHDVVLTKGAVPLDVLEENVKAWILLVKGKK
jgi:uncharacterized protein (DUF885 family)